MPVIKSFYSYLFIPSLSQTHRSMLCPAILGWDSTNHISALPVAHCLALPVRHLPLTQGSVSGPTSPSL